MTKMTKQQRAREGKRMGSVAQGSDTTACEGAHTEEARRYTWLGDYLDRLVGKDDYREFQEHYYGTLGHYAMAGSFVA
jgi:hypothetical protein